MLDTHGRAVCNCREAANFNYSASFLSFHGQFHELIICQKEHMLREDRMIMVRPPENQRLISGYQLCASTEGKSPNATLAVTTSLKYFLNFLSTLRR